VSPVWITDRPADHFNLETQGPTAAIGTAGPWHSIPVPNYAGGARIWHRAETMQDVDFDARPMRPNTGRPVDQSSVRRYPGRTYRN
jgi:hypothetical protein